MKSWCEIMRNHGASQLEMVIEHQMIWALTF